MFGFGIINNYSEVLLSLYKKEKKVFEECENFDDVIKNNLKVIEILNNQVILKSEKINILENIVNLDKSKNFFELVINNSRSNHIPLIIKTFFQKREQLEKIGHVKIISPSYISQKSFENIDILLKQRLNFTKIVFESVIDKDLIGGFVFIVDNNKYDYSLKTSLRNIVKNFNM